MKLTRGKRIALELLGPSAIGTILLYVYLRMAALFFAAQNIALPPGWDPPKIPDMIGLLLFAYLFAGLPSIVYAFVMEWRFSRGLHPSHWNTVWSSTLLGLISGCAIVVALGGGLEGALVLYGGIGISVGFLLGLLIKVWPTEKRNTGENPP